MKKILLFIAFIISFLFVFANSSYAACYQFIDNRFQSCVNSGGTNCGLFQGVTQCCTTGPSECPVGSPNYRPPNQNPQGPAIPAQPAAGNIQTAGTGNDIATLKGLETIFQRIVLAVLGLVAIVLFVYLLYGGIQYITSGGAPDKAAGARNAITYAIYGVVLVALAYLILRAIASITGVNAILNFQIGQ